MAQGGLRVECGDHTCIESGKMSVSTDARMHLNTSTAVSFDTIRNLDFCDLTYIYKGAGAIAREQSRRRNSAGARAREQ